MSSAWGHLAGVVTLLLMAIFIGIWVWAWRPRHKKVFDRMSRIPMSDLDERAPRQERIR
ncbi:MAG: cbb3-type cytochrome c oxidase subunit 3 [Xanthomonadaceae bacterium]|nr:cbb3-type cytochrome c oxidase subunit 3 [Xanthomonadaceae bacterium]